jgi:hypothetical protein
LYSTVSTTACSVCAPGSVTDTLAFDGGSSCTECYIGRYSDDPTRACAQCDPGSFAVRGFTSCTACGRPTCIFAPLGAQYMSNCSGPKWVANAVQSLCASCPAGTQPSSDRSRCDACVSGTASEDGIQCLMCNDTDVNHNQSSVANDARTSCVPCLPGTGANVLGSVCEPCPPFNYASCSGTGCMFCDPSRGLIVTVDKTGCYPSYQCPASTGCPVGQQCDSDRDCLPCRPGYVSAGGAQCRSCADHGPGWVANPRQTDCMMCHPGEMPTADRSACYACRGDYISILGSECQPCSATRIANPTHTECVDYNDPSPPPPPPPTYTGCMDSTADNYDPIANVFGTCLYTGCMDSAAANYDSRATTPANCLYTACFAQMQSLGPGPNDFHPVCCASEPDPAACAAAHAPPPSACTTACAQILGPFWTQCGDIIMSTMGGTSSSAVRAQAFFNQCASIYIADGGH